MDNSITGQCIFNYMLAIIYAGIVQLGLQYSVYCVSFPPDLITTEMASPFHTLTYKCWFYHDS